jgi:hypothetical protein
MRSIPVGGIDVLKRQRLPQQKIFLPVALLHGDLL